MNELKRYWVSTEEFKNYVEDTTNYCEVVSADDAESLLKEKDAEIERLHGNLNTCTERGTKAEAELAKWTRKHDNVDLQDLKEQSEAPHPGSHPYAAYQAYINGLECHLRQVEERGVEAERDLKTAKDALKELKKSKDVICVSTDHARYCDCGSILIDQVLLKLEGGDSKDDAVPYMIAGLEGLCSTPLADPYPVTHEVEDFCKDDEIPEPDWEWITNVSCSHGSGVRRVAEAILYLEGKVTKIEDTIEDIQAKIIEDIQESDPPMD